MSKTKLRIYIAIIGILTLVLLTRFVMNATEAPVVEEEAMEEVVEETEEDVEEVEEEETEEE